MKSETATIARVPDGTTEIRGKRSGRFLKVGDRITAEDGDLVITIRRSGPAYHPADALSVVKVTV